MADIKEILNSPELFASTALKILDKDGNLIPLKWNTVQRSIYPRLTGRDLIVKARQMGVSTMIQGEIFRRLVTTTTRALSLSKDDNGTTYLREMNDRFYKHFPVPKPKRGKDNARQTSYSETDSSHFISTAGSGDVGRGSSFNFIHGTEVAFWKDAEQILAGAMQAGNPFIVLESTANGAQGWFYETCMDALAGRNDWNLIFIPYTEFPEYQGAEWKEKKQKELKRLFDQEYPADVVSAFLLSTTGYFSDIDIDWNAPLNAVYNPEHKYSAGLDFGQSNDFSCMIVVDRTSREMVDKLHINKMSWSLQRDEIRRMYNKWRLSGLKAEKNSIGSVNIEELEKEGMTIESFDTTNTSKNLIFQRTHEELETGFKLMNWDILRSEVNTLVSHQTLTGKWAISADGNAHDDTCIALALALTAKIEPHGKISFYRRQG